MRLTLISDTHGARPPLPEGDILVHCGDLTHFGSFKELQAEVGWLKSLPFEHILFVPGNHDICCENLMLKGLENPLRHQVFGRIRYLRDSGVTIGGINFWGSPWIPPYAGAFNAGLRERMRRWDLIPEGTDVLVTHGPPLGILDGGAGCASLLDAVRRVKPRIHAFGHVHAEGGRKAFVNGTTSVNCAGKPTRASW